MSSQGGSESNSVYAFQAEINQLLSLIINAFYSNKEVSLRELVSNASDALDKIRYRSLTEGNSLLGDDSDLRIRIIPDKANKTLTIWDNGIGMTRDELVKNLGTIAHSGTKAFMQAVESGTADLSLIGQFGMGFYSAYLIAHTVTVVSKSNDEPAAHVWTSTGSGTFTVTESVEGAAAGATRGTRVVLHLKDDQLEYLEESRIREVIKRHSEFIMFPIELQVEREQKVKQEDVQDADKEKEKEKENDVGEGGVEESEAIVKDETMPKETVIKVQEWDQLNQQKPLWTRPAKDVTKEEYAAFYKSIFSDWEDHLAVKHYAAEGQVEYKALLYVPQRAPFDLFAGETKQTNIKLYVRRVFIMDNCEDLCPQYLSFVKGLVDCNDLPLNVSREMLQQNSVLKTVKKSLTKKCIEMFQDLAENKEDYQKFYDNFNKNIKLGIYDDAGNRDKLMELLRFYSTKSQDEMTSLKDYVTRMKEDQKDIYYITGESLQAVRDSPFLEAFRKRGYEVLFMVDTIDEYMMQQMKEYSGKKMVCCTKEGLSFDEDKDVLKTRQEEYAQTCEEIKKVLGDKVQSVKVSLRNTDSPCVLVTPEYGWTANMERIMKAQALRNQDMFNYMSGKRIMEINPDHKVIKGIKQRLAEVEQKEDGKRATDSMITLMYDTAMIASGFTLEEPTRFARSIFRFLQSVMYDEDEDEEGDRSKADGVDDADRGTKEEVKMEEID